MATEDVTNPAVRFVWEVDRGGYQWSEKHELVRPRKVDTTIDKQPRGPWLVSPHPWSARSPVLRYWPLRHRRDLHTEFARLPVGEDGPALEAMRRFANHFGLLGVGHWVYPLAVDANGQRSLYYAEHLSSWLQAISRLQGFSELISAYKRNDAEMLRKCVQWSKGGQAVTFAYRSGKTLIALQHNDELQLPGHREQELARWRTAREPERLTEPTAIYLYEKVNEQLRAHVAPQLIPEIGLTYMPDSLLGALYLMAAEQLTGSWPTNVCANCGSWFVPRSRRDQKTCSASCKQKLYRSRKKHQEDQS